MTIAEEAKYRIDKQCEKGLSKYGHLLDNAGCNELELINHAIEEVCDLFQYLIALRRKIEDNPNKEYRDGKGY